MGKNCEKKKRKGKERREAKKVRETEKQEQSAKRPDFVADQTGDVRKANFEENVGKPVVDEKPVKEKMKPANFGAIEDLVLDVLRDLFNNLEDRQGQGTMWNKEQPVVVTHKFQLIDVLYQRLTTYCGLENKRI